VQQALQKANWPPELDSLSPASSHPASTSAASSAAGIGSAKSSRTGYSEPASRHSTSQSVATGGSESPEQGSSFSTLMRLLLPRRATSKGHHTVASSYRAPSSPGAQASGDDPGDAGLRSAGSHTSKSQRPPDVASAGSMAGHTDPVPSDTGSWQQQQQPKKEPVDGFQSPQLESSRMGSVVTFKLVEKPNKKKANVATVKGLRVRMGVVTGWLSAAAEIKTSALFDLAKGDLQQSFLPPGVSLPISCSTQHLLLMYLVATVEGS